MPEVEVKPFIMRNAVVEFGLDDFAKAVSSATLTPSSGTTDFTGLKPSAVFTFPQATKYTLDLEFAQDWSSETSLSRYLFDHIGEVVDAVINPDDQTAAGEAHTSWAVQVAITPGAIGGPVDSVAVSTVSLGCVGQPVPTFVPATP